MADMQALPPADINEDRTTGLMVAVILTRCIGWTAIVLRFLARRMGHTKLWWDDWIILGVGILLIPAMVLEIQLVDMHMGRRFAWVLQNAPEVLQGFAVRIYAGVLFYSPSVGGAKLSVLCLYYRLFGTNKTFRWVCYVQMGLLMCWIVITEFVFAFRCNPVSLGWALTADNGSCFPFREVFQGTNAVDVIFNFSVLATPLYSIWSLQLPLKKKVLVSAVLFVGCVEAVLSIIRLTQVSSLAFLDYTWDSGTADLWSLVQANLAVVCACIPVLGPLLPRSWLGRRGKSSNNSHSYYTTDPGHSLKRLSERDKSDEHELVGPQAQSHEMNIYRTTEFGVKSETMSPKNASERYATSISG